jgi:hypothetical protein
MGVGDSLSTKAENDHALAEKKREEWEYDNCREGEVKEMVDLYMEKGASCCRLFFLTTRRATLWRSWAGVVRASDAPAGASPP